MAKRKTAKYSMLVTMLCLVLCGAMVLGGTYAWFSDSAESKENIIATGTLDVVMEASDKFDTGYATAGAGSIFDGDILWEPGYTAVKYIKIKNAGDLAFKYGLSFSADETANDAGDKLSEVIDVYVGKGVEVSSRNDLYNLTYAGELVDFLNSEDTTANGVLLTKNSEEVLCVALKMQESAGNEYQGLSIGGEDGIAVKLFAEQYTSEKDYFDNNYDRNAGLPVAAVYRNPAKEGIPTDWATYSFNGFTWGPAAGYEDIALETAYTFTATEEDVDNSPYKEWLCDFYVSLDRDLTADQLFLGGSYAGFENIGFNITDAMISALTSGGTTIPANTQIPLLGSVTGGMSNWTYKQIVESVEEFGCGAADINDALEGAVFTVQLRMTNPADYTEYYNISEVKYTFENVVNNFAAEFANGGNITLNGSIDLEDTPISIPANTNAVLNLNGHTISADFTGTSTYGAFNIPADSSLTIVGNGEVNVDVNINKGISACIFQNDGILNIHGGTYKITHEGSLSGLGAVVAIVDNCASGNDSTVNIYDGTFSVEGVGAPNMFRNWPINNSTATFNIYGGTFNANPDRTTTYIWNKNDTNLGAAKAYVNITGGTFNETYGDFVVEVDGCKEFVSVSVPNVEVIEGTITGFKPVPSV